ncbi:MAG: SMP-30/gluconolactonase/LRE family protein [Hyphomicrobiales bacterium]|nr:SMP-30/gluconolactonase/LRE family protein [Hyphomicrobiales bacterium]MCP5373408.1 SMP-30/gluconolactonase/LRE family protein [Hyphomicrobiales bacterium]
MEIVCVLQNPDTLGESPLWDHRERRLLWIDSLGRRIHALDPATGHRRAWEMPDRIGSIALRRKGGLVAGLRSGFHFVDLDKGVVTPIGDPEPDLPDTRLNDGKCDRQGRFWCGSMNEGFAAANASLYRLDPDLAWHRMDTGFTVSNGIAWSPDGATMYFSDSRVEAYYAYDVDTATGAISNRRRFVDPAGLEGRIDGATVDRDGNYWCALFAGGAVACFDPAGRLLRRIGLPVRHPTMCSFGDPGLDTLYVTTATFALGADEIGEEPLAGSLFAITGTGATGLPEPAFLG